MTHGAGDAGRFESRLAAAAQAAQRHECAALLVAVGPDLRYLTGYAAMPLERLTMLVVSAGGPVALVVPRLEVPAARAGLEAPVPIVAWDETDDAHALVERLVRETVGSLDGRRVAVSDRLWAGHLLRLQAAIAGATWLPASGILRELRMAKDPSEVEALRRAAHAADRVVTAIAAGRLVGRTEADVAREVRDRLIAEGHEVAEFAIVASGPNSASPHHEASGRVIEAGEPIVLDIGGLRSGYGSDITRTLWVTGGDSAKGPDDEFLRLYEVLRGAQAEAVSAVRPGLPAERVDAVARGIIAAGGYGEYFIHRVGHGIGLETHEEPYLVGGNAEPLVEGAAFSVEPGIYLEGRYGARIEDIVVCGPDGPDVLNQVPRDLLVVAG